MKSKKIEQASVDYQMSKHPMAIGGSVFDDMIYIVNINYSFIAGAEWAIDEVNKWLKENGHEELIQNLNEVWQQ